MDMYNFTSTNSLDICWQIVKRNALSINRETICKQLSEHPYSDSLMAISDVLENYNIATTSYNIKDAESLIQQDGSYIALVYVHSQPYFSIIDSVTNESVIWYNPINNRKENISFGEFKNIYGGIVTFVEVKDYIAEPEYKNKKKEYFVKKLIETMPIFVFVIAFVSVFLSLLPFEIPIYFGLYAVGLGIGSLICAVLLYSEVNDYNSSFIEKLCPVGKKWDCSIVLKSAANNIYGINWTTIGLAYFAGTLITLTCVGNTNLSYYQTAACINVLALPFIIYSLYYQVIVSKRWCVMCLSVLTLLLYLFVISILGGFLSLRLNQIMSSVVPFIIIDLIMLWGSNMYLSLCKQNKMYNELFPAFNKLRYDENVFRTLLEESPLIAEVPQDMSINIGQPTAAVTILKVCDPYCSACSKSHLKMEKFLEKKDVFLQVIFNVSSIDRDAKKNAIKLFFALKEKYGDQYMIKVLHDWYGQKEKKYEEFRKKYEIDDKAIDAQEDKIMWMERRTQELEIHYTPTFYINNHQLPDDFYSYNDFESLFE